jgi:general secretion pathway protein C
LFPVKVNHHFPLRSPVQLFLDFFTKYSQKLAGLTVLSLVVVITWSVVETVWFVIDNQTESPIRPPDPVQSQSRTPRSGKRISIADFNLFGVAEQKTIAAPVDAPETKLNLELTGVFTAENKAESTAIVAESNKPGELYHIGDRLPGNAILSAVFDDHILFKRGSRLEKLKFSEKAFQATAVEPVTSKRPSTRPQRRDARSSERLRQSRQRKAQQQRQRSTQRGATGQQSISDVVNSYRERINSDPESVLRELGVESVAAGESSGYRVGNQISQQQLLQAGLQAGDVILSVNGRPVGDVMQDRSMVDQAMAAGRVRVEIQRQERRFFITVPIR